MIKISRPNINDADVAAVTSVLYSESLVQGMQVNDFENEIADFLNSRNVVAVSSGTAALHLCLLDLDIGPDDVVYVPDYTFVATANVARMLNANIVLVDVDVNTYCISVEDFNSKVADTRSKFKKAVVIPVLQFGCPINMKDISSICQEESIEIIEDSACAFGAEYPNYKVGEKGRYCCFSLHPRKTLTTGEGGFISTVSDNVATNLRAYRNHGLIRNADGSISCEKAGLNYRLTDFAAALGRSQMKRLEAALLKRKRLVELYFECLGNEKNIQLPERVSGHSWQTFLVKLPADVSNLEIQKKMKDKGVETSVGAYCLSSQGAYTSLDNKSLVNSRFLAAHGLAIPLCQSLTEEDVRFVSSCLIESIKA